MTGVELKGCSLGDLKEIAWNLGDFKEYVIYAGATAFKTILAQPEIVVVDSKDGPKHFFNGTEVLYCRYLEDHRYLVAAKGKNPQFSPFKVCGYE